MSKNSTYMNKYSFYNHCPKSTFASPGEETDFHKDKVPQELTHWKRPWCWEELRAGGEGDDRGWDGCMASLTQWMWVWVNSGSWWWTGMPGVLRFMGSQRVAHDWATELNWTDFIFLRLHKFLFTCMLDLLYLRVSLLIILSLFHFVFLFILILFCQCVLYCTSLCFNNAL